MTFKNWLKKLWENRLELLLGVLFVSVFFNIRKYFLFDWTYVTGRIVEYRYPALFFSDLLILVLSGFYLWDKDNRLTFWKEIKEFFKVWLLPIYLFVILWVFSGKTETFCYVILRFCLYLVAFFVVKGIVSQKTFFVKVSRNLRYILGLIAVIFILQFIPLGLYLFDQGCWLCTKLGGLDYLVQRFGVSYVSLGGTSFPRNYGFFPHPNVLGAAVAITLAALLYFVNKYKITRRVLFLLICVFVLGILLLISTFSFSALLAFIIGLLVFVLLSRDNRLKILSVPILTGMLLISGLFIFTKDSANLPTRIELVKASLTQIKLYPLTGTTPLGFTRNIPAFKIYDPRGILFLQPVHNIFLLILAEYGVLFGGCIIFRIFSFLHATYKKHGMTSLILILPFLIIANTDHYLWTLNQGILLTITIFIIFSLPQYKQKV